MTIEGYIQFPGVSEPVGPRIVYLRILDVSRIDAPSQTLTEHRIEGLRLAPGPTGLRVPYKIECQTLPSPKRSLILQVHVSLTASKAVQSGDFLTTTSYPIDSRKTHQVMDAVVRLIE